MTNAPCPASWLRRSMVVSCGTVPRSFAVRTRAGGAEDGLVLSIRALLSGLVFSEELNGRKIK